MKGCFNPSNTKSVLLLNSAKDLTVLYWWTAREFFAAW